MKSTAASLLEVKDWLTEQYRHLRKAWSDAESETGNARDLKGWPKIPLGSPACGYCPYAGPEGCNRR